MPACKAKIKKQDSHHICSIPICLIITICMMLAEVSQSYKVHGVKREKVRESLGRMLIDYGQFHTK